MKKETLINSLMLFTLKIKCATGQCNIRFVLVTGFKIHLNNLQNPDQLQKHLMWLFHKLMIMIFNGIEGSRSHAVQGADCGLAAEICAVRLESCIWGPVFILCLAR